VPVQQYVAYVETTGGLAAMPVGAAYSDGYFVATTTTGSFGPCVYGVLTCWDQNSNIFGMGGLASDAFFKLNSSPAVAAIPEPETYALMLGGLGLLAGMAQRGRKQPLA
jgi:hypothetical protein